LHQLFSEKSNIANIQKEIYTRRDILEGGISFAEKIEQENEQNEALKEYPQ